MSRFRWLETAQQPLAEPPAGRPAAAADGSLSQGYLAQADEAARRGDAEKALRFYGRAIAEDRTQARAWLGQVVALVDLGEVEEAVRWADQALAEFPDHPDLLAAKALAFHAGGDAARARGFVDAAFEKPATPFAWFARGAVCARGNAGLAESCFAKAEAGDPGAGFRLRAGRAFLAVGDAARALARLLRARDETPANPWVWESLAECYRALNDVPAAESAAAQVRRLAPHRAEKIAANQPGLLARWARALGWGE